AEAEVEAEPVFEAEPEAEAETEPEAEAAAEPEPEAEAEPESSPNAATLIEWIVDASEESQPDAPAAVPERQYTDAEIRNQIQLSGLTISLQPRYALNQNEVAGAEVSISCRHPIRDKIFPEELASSLREIGKLHMLDRYIFECLCLCQPQDRIGGSQIFELVLPVFPESVTQPDFSRWYIDMINYYEIDPGLFRLDLVYDWPHTQDAAIYQSLQELTEAGFRLALKEVGDTNYPLNIFSEVDLEALVIAEKLVLEAFTLPKKHKLLQALKGLCTQMGFRMEADRIDSREKFQFLTKLGCQVFQGNFLTRPIPLEQFWEYKRKLDTRRSG
ncbi:MAG: EAL domain-containing protein, partial [Peptococcaceae bacterium]|nr:EAL domain-containing protein [Peptococcaceae bacterium]